MLTKMEEEKALLFVTVWGILLLINPECLLRQIFCVGAQNFT
jgi:hypothetical protein